MKVAYNWLKSYLDFPYSPEELSAILTQTGLEVEGLETFEEIQGGLKGVVIGEVLSCQQHPDADKLKVTTVSIGKEEPLQIVCGAPNVAAGQKVVVATVGCTLYPKPEEAFEIKKAKIRGVVSEGMLCAEDELGLGQSHDGILVLPNDTPVGLEAAAYFQLEKDIQLEIGLTPNRADAMGHVGVARDIKAYHNLHEASKIDLRLPAIATLAQDDLSSLLIQIKDLDGCKRYLGLRLENVQVGPSPKWLQNKLKAVGLKPINNVVDISNYVQRELGTPLHIFDAEKVGAALEVRCAKPAETFIGLDNNTYKLAGHELVIANEQNVLCLAGVLGGQDSGVSNQTKTILIESALFDAVRIRKAARQHGLNTDASFRFERGVDPALTEFALLRCVHLLQELTGATVNSRAFHYEGELAAAIELNLSKKEITQLIGNEIPNDQIAQILKDLDFEIRSFDNETWKLIVPAYRIDVTRPIDVIEEILRIYGLDNVSLPEKWNFSLSPQIADSTDFEKENCASFLVGRSYIEVMNNSLSKKQYSELLDEAFGAPVCILNPLSQDLAHMRQSLVFGLLENIVYNQNRQQSDLRLFEFGQDYQIHDTQRRETNRLALALTGKTSPEFWQQTQVAMFDFFRLKKEVNAVLERFGIHNKIEEEPTKNIIFEEGLTYTINNKILAEFGLVKNNFQQAFGIKQEVYYAQFDWAALVTTAQKQQIRFQEVPKSFAVRRDLSLLIASATTYDSLAKCAFRAETKLLNAVELFDVYEGKNLPAGKKSYALAFYLQDSQQTLGEAQIEKAMRRILTALEKECGAELRK
jgi:phenylalanyl-tRNA synthetase beta chain